MSTYTHKKISALRMIAWALRGLVKLLSMWPLLVIAAFFVSPVGPHLRWTYTYQDISPTNRIYYACNYIGSRGFVDFKRGSDCPLITIIDRRES